MRVKICGLMREEDVQVALENGADVVGFIVQSPTSPRNLTLNRAERLMKTVPIFTLKVAVTITEDIKSIKKICSKLRPDALQLYGRNVQLVRQVRRSNPETKIILATGIRDRSSVDTATRTAKESDAVLADTVDNRGMGGTGQVHDWNLTATIRKRIHPKPLILAGGLTPKNVRQAIKQVEPYGVDVSSGVERAVGVKDQQKIRDFITNAKGTQN